MGSVKKWVNPVSATKTVVGAITGKGSSGGTTTVTTPAEAAAAEAAAADPVTKANQAQYMAKQRTDNQADISGTLATGLEGQASAPTMLSGLGGVTTDEKKLGRRRPLGV